jgi:hypothetical protein
LYECFLIHPQLVIKQQIFKNFSNIFNVGYKWRPTKVTNVKFCIPPILIIIILTEFIILMFNSLP